MIIKWKLGFLVEPIETSPRPLRFFLAQNTQAANLKKKN